MNERYLLILTMFMMVGFEVGLAKIIVELKRPRYMRPKNFLKMGDVETLLADGLTCGPIKIPHSYIEECGGNMFFIENDGG